MRPSVYDVEATNEQTHWWFVGRRHLVSGMIRALGVDPSARALDIGTSTGTNLRMLRELGFEHATGVDLSVEAIRYCAGKDLGAVGQSDACALPFRDGSFDLVLATDIVEHVDDDVCALSEIRRVLRNDGVAIVTVPCFQFLWGLQDRVSLHKRRYRLPQLLDVAAKAGLWATTSFYFNYLLFVPILAARKLMQLFRIELESEGQVNTRLMNVAFAKLFRFDVDSARRIRPPFGVSALAVLRKTAPAGGSAQ